MGGFPALPSGNNPAAGMASSVMGASASAYNGVLNALHAAAAQHAAQQERDKEQADAAAQKGLQTDLEMAKLGATRTQGPAPGKPTLAQRPADTQADAPAGGSVIPDPRGGTWTVPDQTRQKGEFVPTGGLGDALKSAGWDGKTPVTPEQSHALMQALNEAAPKDEPFDIDTSGKFLDAQGQPAAVTIGKKTGKVRMLNLSGDQGQVSEQQKQGAIAPGTELPQGGGTPGGAFSFAPPPKAAKTPKSLHFEKDTNDAGDVVTRGFDDETGELVSTKVEKGIGPKRKDPDAPKAEKPLKMTPATARTIRAKMAAALAGANKQYAADMKDAAKGPDGKIITPDTLEGGPDPTEKRRQAYAAAQDEYEKSIAEATGNDVPHNGWADAPAPPAQTPAAPVAQPTPKAPGPWPSGYVPAPPATPQPAQRGAAPAAPKTAAPAGKAAPNPYIVGRTYSGMKYNGGDPNNRASWGQ